MPRLLQPCGRVDAAAREAAALTAYASGEEALREVRRMRGDDFRCALSKPTRSAWLDHPEKAVIDANRLHRL